MNARPFGWFIAIAFVVLILILGCQSIVLHLHVLHPRTHLDYYLFGVAGRSSSWVYSGDFIIADVAIFLHKPVMIISWLAGSVLFWGLFITRGGPGSET
jgi:hypothetical protein